MHSAQAQHDAFPAAYMREERSQLASILQVVVNQHDGLHPSVRDECCEKLDWDGNSNSCSEWMLRRPNWVNGLRL